MQSQRLFGLGSQLLGLGNSVLDATNHVESVLGQVVVLTVQDLLEGSDGLLQSHQLTGDTSENLGDSEWLGQESLDLSGSLDGQLVGLGQLIHTQNGNDILQGLVSLQGLLDTGSNIVVLLTDNRGIQQSRLGVQWVDSRVDTQLGNTSRQHSGGIQVSESGSWGRVSQVIGWDVDSLDRGNGTLLGGGNSLLQGTHIGGQGWLVTDSRWNTTQQGGHLGTSLSESENVVNEQQHILTFFVSEVFSNGQTGQSNSSSGSWWLVHLTENQGDLGVTLEVDDTGLLHFTVQIVTLSGSLTDTGENGETTVGLGNVVNQLLDEHGLTDTGTTEQTNLTTSGVRGQQVDNLDTSLQNLSRSRLLNEGWWVSVDRVSLLRLDWSSLVNWLTNNVDDTAQGLTANRHGDRSTSVGDRLASDQTVSTVHSNGSDGVLTQMLGNLQDQVLVAVLQLQSVENGWQVTILEVDVNDGTNDGSVLLVIEMLLVGGSAETGEKARSSHLIGR